MVGRTVTSTEQRYDFEDEVSHYFLAVDKWTRRLLLRYVTTGAKDKHDVLEPVPGGRAGNESQT